MKINEIKHNHSLTDLLKVILFALLMLAPIGAVASRCLYVICNKNAYQSYSGANGYSIQYKYETNEVNDVSDIEVGNIYYLDIDYNNLPTSTTSLVTCSFVTFDYYDSQNDLMKYELNCNQINTTSLYLQFIKATNNFIYVRDSYNNDTFIQMNINNIRNLNFVFISSTNQLAMSWIKEGTYNVIEGVTISNEGTLDNVFDYSVNKLEQSQMFNWTENTLIYTGINNMCTELNITRPAIPMILTYWLILTCIYVIIDIVLKLFTMLTHMISNRKA